MIRTIIDYIRLRNMGLSPKTAWKIAFKPSYKFDYFVIVMALLALAFLALEYAYVTEKLKRSEIQWQAVSANVKANTQFAISNNLEQILIACLNGESVAIDGVDRPCKVGEFKNGKEVF